MGRVGGGSQELDGDEAQIDRREEGHAGPEQERLDGKVLNLGSSKTREGPGKQERGREGDCGQGSPVAW